MTRKARQLDTLSLVSETVVSNRVIEDVMQLIVTMTAQMMQSKICSIMLLTTLPVNCGLSRLKVSVSNIGSSQTSR